MTGRSDHRGTRAIQRMVEFAPSTGGLALWIRHVDEEEAAAPAAHAAHATRATRAVHATSEAREAPVATDGSTVFYRPAFDALPLAEQAGWVAHEVLHVALRHAQRCTELQRLLGDVDPALFNACADAIVNSTLAPLRWLALPASAVMLERVLAGALGLDQAVEKSLLEWDVERLYRAVDDRRAPDDASRKGRHGTPVPARQDGTRAAFVRVLGGAQGADLLPADAGAETPEAQAEQAREWRERLLRAHAGDGEFSMLRVLIADLPSSRTPWEQALRVQMARALSRRPALSWSRPSRSYIANQGRGGPHRRLPWEPGFSGLQPAPRLLLVVDVSGSIEDELLDRFAREIDALTRRLESRVVLVIGDDAVQRVLQLEPGRSELRGIEFNGRGGTDFTPLLEEADRHRPDLCIVLTDLDGPARFKPRWPVIWAVPEAHATATAPFGRTLVLR